MKINIRIPIKKKKGLGFGLYIARYDYTPTSKKNEIKEEKPLGGNHKGKLVKYIHIGFPKAASTALQNGFFNKHNELHHLGAGTRVNNDYWDDLGYIDKNINIAMEIDLRYRNSLSYNKKRLNEIFNPYFEEAKERPDKKAVGISNENLSFQWNYGIDIEEKAKRLFNIFGPDTKIIIVTREQESLIKSLYKEQIRFGYDGTFNDYLDYMWRYKDRSFLYDFCFDKIADVYAKYFGKENIHLLPFELFKTNQTQFLKQLSQILKIDSEIITEIKTVYNKQLSEKALNVKRIINSKYKHSNGNGFYHIFDNHRYTPYFTDELNEEIPFEVFFDYQIRHHLSNAATKIASLKEVENIDLSYDQKYINIFKNTYYESNRILSKTYNINLKSFGYLK